MGLSQDYHLLSERQENSSTEDFETDLSKESRHGSVVLRFAQRFRVLLAIFNLISVVTVVILSTWMYHERNSEAFHDRCIREMNNFSPITNDLHLHYELKKIDGRLLDANHSIFLREPNLLTDEAWKRISDSKFVFFSGSDLVKMGHDPTDMALLPESWGYGPNVYAGELDITHKIHCLDTLRREMYFDHYWGWKYSNRSELTEAHKMHVNHCLKVLLETLTCDANPDIVPMVWVKGQDSPFPDFSIQRKCGNLEALLQWQEDHEIDKDRYLRELRKPESEKQTLLSPELRRIFGWAPGRGDASA